MRIFRSTGKFVYKTFLDIPSWMSFHQIKQNTSSLATILRSVFAPRQPSGINTFEEATAKFGLSEADIQQRAHAFLRNSIIFLVCGCLCLIYVFYLFFTRHFLAGFIAFLASGLFFIQAFSAHFSYFQIKHRKLGCTFKEWLNGHITEDHT